MTQTLRFLGADRLKKFFHGSASPQHKCFFWAPNVRHGVLCAGSFPSAWDHLPPPRIVCDPVMFDGTVTVHARYQ